MRTAICDYCERRYVQGQGFVNEKGAYCSASCARKDWMGGPVVDCR